MGAGKEFVKWVPPIEKALSQAPTNLISEIEGRKSLVYRVNRQQIHIGAGDPSDPQYQIH